MKDESPLSTSALARALKRPVRRMFAELAVMGWIRRDGEQWQLTEKGRFEGGLYRESSRFGRYIVWPASVLEHRAIVQTRNQHLSASLIGREYGLDAQTVNRLLVERGWLRADGRGWRPTESGREQGALQREDERTGVSYVVWPPEMAVHPVLLRSIERLKAPEGDGSETMMATLDGHHCSGEVSARLCNWLYLAGIVHGVDVALPIDTLERCDLYLPALQLFIDDCSDETDAGGLSGRIQRQTLCERHGIELLQVSADEVPEVEQWLARELRKRGLDI